jgi:Bacterial Ig-like domain (group 3)/IPT/TIG domain
MQEICTAAATIRSAGRSRTGRALGFARLALAALIVLLASIALATTTATAARTTTTKVARASALPTDPFGAQSDPFATPSRLPAVTPGAGAPTPTRYEQAVLADHPTLYLPLTESSGPTAFDHSGNGLDGTYDLGVSHEDTGPLLDEENFAVYGSGEVVSQSGDKLPSGAAARTLELWVHDTGTESLSLARYGDTEGGHGFAVTIHEQVLSVEASGHTVSVSTVDGFGHWCCDGTGWHMVDVTYDGERVEIYQDGQLLGGGVLGNAETAEPGQGLRLDASYGVCCGGAAPYGLAEAAIYPAALTPEQIGTHWSAGASTREQAECAPKPSGPYPGSVLEDSPIVYYRAGETSAEPKDRVAFDSSGHCFNATFDLGTATGGGALPGDADPAIFGNGQAIFQSGEELPAGAEPRTLEFWIHDIGTENLTLARYGDVEGRHGFAVTIHEQVLTVEGGAGHSVSASTLDGFGHWCCDGTGWHMVDVTYDGKTADIYQDGQLIGSGPFGETETAVPGQGLRLNTSYGVCCGGAAPYGLDEVAVYGSALSSARIVAHWEAASRPPEGYAVLAGTVINGGGGRVQACPTSGAACTVDRYAIDSSGAFHMLVPNGTYTVTIFPPAGSTSGPKTIGPIVVPPSDLNIKAAFSVAGGLPEGESLSSPGRGTQENTIPGINWGEPSTIKIKGCKGGYGYVFVHATNTSTGQEEVRSAELRETAPESGEYEAPLAPLAPLHGQAGVESGVTCPEHSRIVPDGGSPAGGTVVFVAGSGFTGATGVKFGGVTAKAFTVEADDRISAEAPPGVGTVPVTVEKRDGTTAAVGNFHYFALTSISSGEGTAGGGETITLHGKGLSNITGVVFGTMPAASFNVINEEEVTATTPAGLGTVDVQVMSGLALTSPTAVARYTYKGGPAGAAAISETTDSAASFSLAQQIAGLCSQIPDPSNSGGIDFGPLCKSAQDELNPLHWFGDSMAALGLFALPVACIAGPVVCAIGAAAEIAYWGWRLGVHACFFNCPNGSWFDIWIDPSGTVVDTKGNPIEGATATLLEQPLTVGTPFTPVEPSSGAIEPAENPEITKASGQFDWNALAGTYQVRASAPGCHAPGEPAQASVLTAPFTIPPAAVGLMLTLECASAPAPTPKVASLSASTGAAAGGNIVDISGEGLADVTAVHFGDNTSVHVQSLSPYAVAAVAPAGTGTVDVTVSGPGGSSATSEADRYTYSTPVVNTNGPVVELVTPNTGPVSGGTAVTINGVHLGGAFAVQFGGAPAAQVVAKSDSEVQAVAPAGAFPERIDVTVTTATGSSAPTLTDSFTYGSPPPRLATSVALTPSEGTVAHGQTLTLRATVSPSDGGGSVAFYADGSTTPLSNCGAQALAAAGGAHVATCATSALAVGQHSLKAGYSGDPSYAESSGAATVSVGLSAEEEAKLKAEREATEKAEREQHERESQEAAARGHAQEEAAARRLGEEAAADRQREGAARSQVLATKGSRTKPAMTRTQLLAKALRACRKTRNKAKRRICEKRTQERYGATHRTKRGRGRRT